MTGRDKALRAAILLLGLGISAVGLFADLGGPGRGTGQYAVAVAGLGVALCSLLQQVWIERLLLGAGGVVVGLGGGDRSTDISSGRPFDHSSGRRRGPVPSHSQFDQDLSSLPGQRRGKRAGERQQCGLQGTGDSGLERGRRILVYGDSFVAAEFSSDEKTFVRRLEDYLRQSSEEEIEVINAGVAGYGPDQVSLRMERELAGLNPDLVIVAICAANDFGDLIRNKLYSLDASGALEPEMQCCPMSSLSELRDGVDPLDFLQVHPQDLVLSVDGRRAPKEQPELAEYQARRVKGWLGDRVREYEETVVVGDRVVRDLFGDYYDLDISLTPNSDSAKYKLRLMGTGLLEIVRQGQARGVPVVFVFIPADIDACNERDLVRIDRSEFPAYRRSALTDALERIAERHSLHYLSLFQIFRDNGPDGLYFRGNESHWNDQGQDLAAKRVAEYLYSTGL